MKYRCGVCGYTYDDEKENVPFNDLPDDWVCPLCGAPKALFELVEETKVEEVKEVLKKEVVVEEDVEISAKELAIIFANLARGAEKQYKDEENKLLSKLKDYFNGIKGEASEAKVSYIIGELNDDLKVRYENAKNCAKIDNDRGALRALTWSSKVTTMLKSLLERYEKEGNAMLDGKHVYVCTICGFVYVGEKAPELCPVCKVPSFKFEEVL